RPPARGASVSVVYAVERRVWRDEVLVELRVRDLGVIAEAHVVLGPGLTALTGETGAGKTLLVEAIELLVGGRAESVLVRPGAEEAWVEGRFVVDGREVVLARAVPASGRSRAYVDGRMAPVGALAEAGAELVDLHGQHAHQALLSAPAQRAALDRFGEVDLRPLHEARARLHAIEQSLDALGGDERARAREIDLLRYQVDEVDGARIDGPDEDERLAEEEERLADATAHREAAAAAHAALAEEGRAGDALGSALAAVAGRSPLRDLEGRLRSLVAEVGDVGTELRAAAEQLEDDPERLDAVRGRRRQLHELRKKYGATLAEVLAFAEQARARLDELLSHDRRAAELDRDREQATEAVAAAERAVLAARRDAAPRLAAAVEAHLQDLAMAGARVEVEVGEEPPGDRVAFLLGANPGEPALPLSKVASGGELARTMLALRLALRDDAGAPTVVFDEVDAGIGGTAALAVGRSLAALAGDLQVLVVTHLPQVAAFADRQVVVRKGEREGRTVAEASVLEPAARVVELSRMLSGTPDSDAAREHAAELLAGAARERGR
ncbi:MAG TPA: DNA repair protein RecN, partial [Acidimicrobiales bacterium]|nr:DNA repair protein RecN [Acidimicrobiales bacterium]